jgi:RNA polymerase sigma factor (sigma-70 family)
MTGLGAASESLPPGDYITGAGKNEIMERIFKEVRCPAEEEDFQQEAALIVFRRRKLPQNLDHGKAMLALARREAKRGLRHKNLHITFSLDALLDTGWEPVAKTNLLAEVIREELRQAMAVALFMLSARCREVIVLRFFEDLTRKKIAEKLSITSQEVIACESTALAVLRRLLVTFSPVGKEIVGFGPLFGD